MRVLHIVCIEIVVVEAPVLSQEEWVSRDINELTLLEGGLFLIFLYIQIFLEVLGVELALGFVSAFDDTFIVIFLLILD